VKNVTKGLIILLIFITALSAGCQKTVKVTMGEISGNTYTNDYFGVTLDLPAGWTILDDETKKLVMGVGSEMMSGGDSAKQKQLDLAQQKTLPLLFAFKFPLNYTSGPNPNIICMAEQISKLHVLIGIKTSQDYLEAMKTELSGAPIEYTFADDIYTEQIDGRTFSVLEAMLDTGIKVYQKYYAALVDEDRYVLSFVVSYSNEEEQTELANVLRTVRFK